MLIVEILYSGACQSSVNRVGIPSGDGRRDVTVRFYGLAIGTYSNCEIYARILTLGGVPKVGSVFGILKVSPFSIYFSSSSFEIKRLRDSILSKGSVGSRSTVSPEELNLGQTLLVAGASCIITYFVKQLAASLPFSAASGLNVPTSNSGGPLQYCFIDRQVVKTVLTNVLTNLLHDYSKWAATGFDGSFVKDDNPYGFLEDLGKDAIVYAFEDANEWLCGDLSSTLNLQIDLYFQEVDRIDPACRAEDIVHNIRNAEFFGGEILYNTHVTDGNEVIGFSLDGNVNADEVYPIDSQLLLVELELSQALERSENILNTKTSFLPAVNNAEDCLSRDDNDCVISAGSDDIREKDTAILSNSLQQSTDPDNLYDLADVFVNATLSGLIVAALNKYNAVPSDETQKPEFQKALEDDGGILVTEKLLQYWFGSGDVNNTNVFYPLAFINREIYKDLINTLNILKTHEVSGDGRGVCIGECERHYVRTVYWKETYKKKVLKWNGYRTETRTRTRSRDIFELRGLTLLTIPLYEYNRSALNNILTNRELTNIELLGIPVNGALRTLNDKLEDSFGFIDTSASGDKIVTISDILEKDGEKEEHDRLFTEDSNSETPIAMLPIVFDGTEIKKTEEIDLRSIESLLERKYGFDDINEEFGSNTSENLAKKLKDDASVLANLIEQIKNNLGDFESFLDPHYLNAYSDLYINTLISLTLLGDKAREEGKDEEFLEFLDVNIGGTDPLIRVALLENPTDNIRERVSVDIGYKKNDTENPEITNLLTEDLDPDNISVSSSSDGQIIEVNIKTNNKLPFYIFESNEFGRIVQDTPNSCFVSNGIANQGDAIKDGKNTVRIRPVIGGFFEHGDRITCDFHIVDSSNNASDKIRLNFDIKDTYKDHTLAILSVVQPLKMIFPGNRTQFELDFPKSNKPSSSEYDVSELCKPLNTNDLTIIEPFIGANEESTLKNPERARGYIQTLGDDYTILDCTLGEINGKVLEIVRDRPYNRETVKDLLLLARSFFTGDSKTIGEIRRVVVSEFDLTSGRFNQSEVDEILENFGSFNFTRILKLYDDKIDSLKRDLEKDYNDVIFRSINNE